MKITLNLITLMILLCSCNSEDSYRMPLDEFPPIQLSFILVNERGEDLLNSKNSENILNEEISISYKENNYTLNSPFKVNPNNESSPADFKGLRLSTYQDKYVLVFGELDGSDYYKDEKLVLRFIAQNRKYALAQEVKIYSIWTYDKDGYPSFHRIYTTEGEILNENSATPIIKIICNDPSSYGF